MITDLARPVPLRGSVRIQFLFADGSLDREFDLGKNVITLSSTLLFAALIKDPNTPPITHLAVGTGTPPYPILTPPSTTAQTKLVAELTRNRVAFTNYVNEDGDPTLENTNIVDLTTQFATTEAVGTLQEMGLFGGLNATNRNGGFITNYKGFSPFVKPNDRIMVITWRLRFEI